MTACVVVTSIGVVVLFLAGSKSPVVLFPVDFFCLRPLDVRIIMTGADTTGAMRQQMQMQASPMPTDNSKLFQAEHDNLEVSHHKDALAAADVAALRELRSAA